MSPNTDYEPDPELHKPKPPNDFLKGYEKGKPYGPDEKEFPSPNRLHRA